MPRGNDAKEALHELADKFGTGVGNAEHLIDANLAANTEELRIAQSLPRDHEATQEKLKDIEKIKGPDGEEVVSLAVRGAPDSPNRYTVIVYRTEEGRDLVACLDDKGKPVGPREVAPADEDVPKGVSEGAKGRDRSGSL